MSQAIIYGIANCDTMKKARKWLDSRNIAYEFHDYRKQGLDLDMIRRFEQKLGWEVMLNRRGTTWRGLSDATRDGINRESAMQVMLENPAIIKRPILARDDSLFIGFSDQQYQELFE